MMKVNIAIPSTLDKLCESLSIAYKVPLDGLRDVVQNELSTTITQYIENNRLTDVENPMNADQLPNGDGIYYMSCPINDLSELANLVTKYGRVEVFIRTQSLVKDGTQFNNRWIVYPNTAITEMIPVFHISRNGGVWEVQVDSSVPTRYIDINLYSKCWKCTTNRLIRDFLNDTYRRVLGIGSYSPTANPSLVSKLNESGEDDEVQYTIEYNPDDIVVYIKENFDDEPDDDSDRDGMIEDLFMSMIPDAKSCKIINEGSISNAIITTGASYMIGKSVLNALSNLGAKIVPLENPNADKYKAIQQMAMSHRRIK